MSYLNRTTILWASVLICATWSGSAMAQSPDNGPPSLRIFDPNVVPASGCCGAGPTYGTMEYSCNGNACGDCVPGRKPCRGCDSESCFGRLFGGICDAICCPDPCYEPTWIPAANAAFFQDSPRPVTQTRIRWDAVRNYRFPDSAEFFWARVGGKGPANPTSGLHYDEFNLYQEIAAKGASFIFEIPYRSIDPVNNPSSAGFGDINIAAKTVLLDRELILVSMQFRTTIPAGNFSSGLGIGHVALEPSILAALKLTPTTYLQTEFAEWIPIGGTPGFAGSTFHYHFSINQNVCRYWDCLNIVATGELNGYSFRGQFTDFPSGAVVDMAGASYVNMGGGLRVQFCDRVDFGIAAAFGLGHGHGPAQMYRTELRMRF